VIIGEEQEVELESATSQNIATSAWAGSVIGALVYRPLLHPNPYKPVQPILNFLLVYLLYYSFFLLSGICSSNIKHLPPSAQPCGSPTLPSRHRTGRVSAYRLSYMTEGVRVLFLICVFSPKIYRIVFNLYSP
jgi:hypothetical protein